MQPEPEIEEYDRPAAASDTPQRMDRAVRAALSLRPAELRSFGNEDDVEGARPPAA